MSEPCDCSVPTAGDVHARHDVPATAAAAPPNALWPPDRDGRVRLLHSAGCPVELMAEVLGCSQGDVRQRLARLGLIEGKGCVLSVDEQIRALHAAGLGYAGVMAATGIRSPNTVRLNFARLGLAPNRLNDRVRRVLRRNARRQVLQSVGWINGGRHLIDLRRLHWRSLAGRAGWARVLDRLEYPSPNQVRLLDLLADAGDRGREATAKDLAAALGLKDVPRVRDGLLLPLVRAGLVASRRARPSGPGQPPTLYRLADGVGRWRRPDVGEGDNRRDKTNTHEPRVMRVRRAT